MTALLAANAGVLQIFLGLLLALAACLVTRLAVAAPWRWSAGLLVEILLPLTSFILITAVSARPLFAGVTTLLLGAGYAYADRAKRRVLAEPIVFTDVFQAFDIFRHPRLALPFPKLAPVLAGALAGIAFFAAWFVLEPPVWELTWLSVLSVVLLLVAAGMLLPRFFKSRLAGWLRARGLSGDPAADAQCFGPFGVLLAYGFLAYAERQQRRERVPPIIAPTGLRPARTGAGPLVLLQGESFFDARRAHPDIDAGLLPNWDRLLRMGAQCGRLTVPSWGANTVRTEFSVLTGMQQHAIGYDRFNPYHRFAGSPINSLAWRLRAMGHRTICLHPFDRSFYGRHRVLPNLGFEVFIGEEAFVGAERVNGFVADREVARRAVQILEENGPYVFLFIITMENHGPWPASSDDDAATPWTAVLDLPLVARRSFERYLQSLRNTDAMLKTLGDVVDAGKVPGVLAFYGDHLPALGSTFSRLQLNDLRSDYLIRRSGQQETLQRDLAAHELHGAVLQTWSEMLPARMRQGFAVDAGYPGPMRSVLG